MGDENSSGTLTPDEFRKLGTCLDGKLPDAELEHLFSYCDPDGSQYITAEEFDAGWAYLSERVVEAEITRMGASTLEIAASAFLAACALVILLTFIFTALSGWYSQNTFGSIVQTALVTGCGKAVVALRKRAPAESSNIDDLVNQLDDEVSGGDEDDGGA